MGADPFPVGDLDLRSLVEVAQILLCCNGCTHGCSLSEFSLTKPCVSLPALALATEVLHPLNEVVANQQPLFLGQRGAQPELGHHLRHDERHQTELLPGKPEHVSHVVLPSHRESPEGVEVDDALL